jgi:signal transduction histidine kinase
MSETSEPKRSAKILVIDDEELNCRLLQRIFLEAGYAEPVIVTDSRQAAKAFEQINPDLVLVDVHMTHVDGFTVLKQIRALSIEGTFLPVVMIAADPTAELKKAGMNAGATDFIHKPFNQAEILLRAKNLIEMRFMHLEAKEQNKLLERKVRERTAKLDKAMKKLESTQKQIIQSERLSALGMMAGGIAHDFNNGLSVILGYGEIVFNKCRDEIKSKDLTSKMQTVLTAAQDCVQTVNRLAEFHRPNEKDGISAPVDVNALVRSAISITEPRWKNEAMGNGATIRMNTQLHGVLTINGSGGELRNSLTNLIFNAVDAMPHGGTITIATRKEKDRAVIEVTDTGSGMTQEVKRHCLEPFYTTKGDRGAGLGLAIVYGCATRHHGEIEVDSAPGKGTSIRLSIPLVPPKKEATGVAQPVVHSQPLNILLVDDQPLFCDLIAHYLEHDSHHVEKALNGREALAKFRNGKFDLIITDRAMPEFNGDQLAAAVKHINPAANVILLTGFLFDCDTQQPSASIDLVLRKPVSPTALRQAIAQVMKKENASCASK